MFARMFEELEQLRRSMDRLFEQTLPARWSAGETTAEWSFTPPIETGWTDESLNLRVVLPGVTEKDLNLSIQGNQLQIRGERKPPENFGREDAVWHVIPYGKFDRTVDLPNGLNLEALEARLHDGVLDIRIPLAAEVKPKRIQIQVGEEPKRLAAA